MNLLILTEYNHYLATYTWTCLPLPSASTT